jgi:cytochrome P450
MLLPSPGLQDELRRGGDEAVAGFVEESLRIYGVAHMTMLTANEDCEVGGVPVPRDSTVLPMLAAANLDPDHYDSPHDVDLERENPRDHTAFFMGPRSCAGMWLARGELAEMYAGILSRLAGLRLDPDAEPPRMQGFVARSYKPLHALFTPVR